MNWQEYYRSRTISPDEAAAMVKPGMRVDFPLAAGTVIQRALAARGKQIGGVVIPGCPRRLPTGDGWVETSRGISRSSSSCSSATWDAPRTTGNRRRTCPIYFRPHSSPTTSGRRKTSRSTRFRQRHHAQREGFRQLWAASVEQADVRAARTSCDCRGRREPDAHLRRRVHACLEFEYFVEGTPPPPDQAVIESALAAMDAEKRDGIRAIIAEVGVERIWPLVQYLQRTPLSDFACCSASRRRLRSSRRLRDTSANLSKTA